MVYTWWRHRMETFSALLAICAGNSPASAQRPVTRNFDLFFNLCLNKRLRKQSWGWWFDVTVMILLLYRIVSILCTHAAVVAQCSLMNRSWLTSTLYMVCQIKSLVRNGINQASEVLITVVKILWWINHAHMYLIYVDNSCVIYEHRFANM